MVKNVEKIKKNLEAKKQNLLKVINGDAPIVNSLELQRAHERKILNAKIYLEELEEVMQALTSNVDIHLVPLSTLDKQINKADFCDYEHDGQFCTLVVIQNFPATKKLWLLYTAPLSAL